MSKLKEIKLQLELWDNRYPLDPPSDKHAEILYETVRQKANIFKDNSIEHVRYLLSKLEAAEKALEQIVEETSKGNSDDMVKPWQISKQALQQLRS